MVISINFSEFTMKIRNLYFQLAIDALDIWDSRNKEIHNLSDEDKASFINSNLQFFSCC